MYRLFSVWFWVAICKAFIIHDEIDRKNGDKGELVKFFTNHSKVWIAKIIILNLEWKENVLSKKQIQPFYKKIFLAKSKTCKKEGCGLRKQKFDLQNSKSEHKRCDRQRVYLILCNFFRFRPLSPGLVTKSGQNKNLAPKW